MPQMITRKVDSVQTDWQKELAQAITDPQQLLHSVGLDAQHWQGGFAARKLFPMRVPLPFVRRMRRGDPDDPLLRQVLPMAEEFLLTPGFSTDPLEEHQAAVPGLLHKYKSRVLLIVRGGCAINCRYCFRRHFPYQENRPGDHGWQAALDYIGAHPEINEVILSGGDPLMARDDHLARLIDSLSAIPHLRRLRLHTRLPVVIPARITDTLVKVLQQPGLKTVMVLHVNHANEIDAELTQACQRLAQAGITLLNQTVLLRGINDTPTAQTDLSEALFAAGILPYYLHLLDRVAGASHFEVSETQATSLMAAMLAELPGFLVPRLVREIGGRPSKTPVDLGLTTEAEMTAENRD